MPTPELRRGATGRPTNIGPSIPAYFDADLHLMPGVHIPLRSMFVPLRGVLISPVGSDAERAVMPQVEAIVEPSLLHHKCLASARKLAPQAEVWGPPGFGEKIHDVANVRVLGRDAWPYDGEIAFAMIEGAPKRNEMVFLHRPTRTLYTADLVFNIQQPAGLLSPLTFRAMGIYRRFAVARMWKHWIEDRPAFDRSIAKVLAWDFQKIVMAHGDVVDTDAKPRFCEALRERDLLAR
jgi:hypothetical protein